MEFDSNKPPTQQLPRFLAVDQTRATVLYETTYGNRLRSVAFFFNLASRITTRYCFHFGGTTQTETLNQNTRSIIQPASLRRATAQVRILSLVKCYAE